MPDGQNPPHGWTCFFCGDTFTKFVDARDHFGGDLGETAACRIKGREEHGLVQALRAAETELRGYRAEDSAKDRQMVAMAADHARALREAEEEGYAKGLADGRALGPGL